MTSFEDRSSLPPPARDELDLPRFAPIRANGPGIDLTAALEATASALRAVTGADRSDLYVHDPVRDTLRRLAADGRDETRDEQVSLQGRPVGAVPFWYAVRDCPSGLLELPDTVAARGLSPSRARQIGMGSGVGFALRHPGLVEAGGAPTAIAFCTWREPRRMCSPKALRDARAVAAQAATALATAHTQLQGEDLVRRLSLLAAWAARLAASDAPDRVRERAARAAAMLLDGTLAAYWSPGAMAWYPNPPVDGDDVEPAMATLAGQADGFRQVGRAELPEPLVTLLGDPGLDHAAVAVSQDRLGLLLVVRTSRSTALDEQIATLLADLAGAALRTAEAHAEVAHLALTDPLTNVGNRRAFELRAEEAVALSVRTGRPTSLCLIDLDNFRHFNDTGGHRTGDEALRLVADSLRAQMRTSDQAFRIGGDEFALVLEDTPSSSAVSLLNRVLGALRVTRFGALSITAGIAEAPADGQDVATLTAAADDALYAGKRAGRGRVAVAAPRDDGHRGA